MPDAQPLDYTFTAPIRSMDEIGVGWYGLVLESSVEFFGTGKAVKVYVYGMATGQPVVIHAATHAPPFAGKQEGRGFTGFHAVYEPTKSSELQYWCEHLP